MQALERDKLFLGIAGAFAMHSTCLRGHTGAVIALHDRIISTGYNGAPPGMPHCTDVGCGGGVEDPLLGPRKEKIIRFPHGCTRATHAEANAVAFAARYGTPCGGGTVYCTHSPCVACAHILGAAGIVRVVYGEAYRIREPIEMLREMGMEVMQLA